MTCEFLSINIIIDLYYFEENFWGENNYVILLTLVQWTKLKKFF